MTNLAVIVIYAAFFVTSAITLILTIGKTHRSKLDGNLIFIGAMVLGWLIFEMGFFMTDDPGTARLFFDWKLPFVALCALSWFLFTVNFYGLERRVLVSVVVALLVIPAFTLILALTTTEHGLLREGFVFHASTTLNTFEQVRGVWFWFHSAYCYTLIVAAFLVGVSQHSKTPKHYRLSSALLTLGLSISFMASIATLFIETPLDFTLLGSCVSLICLYQATKNHQGLAFVIDARREAFHHIKEAVFILSSREAIVNMNHSAQKMFDELGIKADQSFSLVVKQMRDLSVRQELMDDVEGGTDYHFESGTVYNLRMKSILDNFGKPMGYFAFISDETDNRELIEYLDRHSGLDALTGLSNRRQIEEDIALLDGDAYYPLSILFGDLNYLKETNDLYGHNQGDILLRLVAEAMKSSSPPNARIGRMGGDEFMVVLPNYDEQQTRLLVKEIRKYLDRESAKYLFTVSMAFGYSIKYEKHENIVDIVVQADANMYSDKRRIKSRRQSQEQGQR